MSILKYITILFAIVAIASCLDQAKSKVVKVAEKRMVDRNASAIVDTVSNEAKPKSLQSEILPVKEEVHDSKTGVSVFKVNTNTKGPLLVHSEVVQNHVVHSEISSTIPVVETSSPVPKNKIVLNKSRSTTTTSIPVETAEAPEVIPDSESKQRVVKTNATKNNMGELNKKERIHFKGELSNKSKSLGKITEGARKQHKPSKTTTASPHASHHTTLRSTTLRTMSEKSERFTTERSTTERSTTERSTTERSTTERTTRSTTERSTTERTTRSTTERSTTERTTRSTTERSTTEHSTTAETTTQGATTHSLLSSTTVEIGRSRINKMSKINKH